MHPSVGVAVTTFNRREMFERTIAIWRRMHQGPLLVVDDGSDVPVPTSTRYEVIRHPQNLGIAAAKNTALEALDAMNCQHIFLADDDTVPTRETWADEVIAAGQPFLIHGFGSAPSHWATKGKPHGPLVSWDKPRGCLMYVNAADVLPVAGGLHTAFGKHGGEHGNWADRIHAAGLTPLPHLSLADSPFYCADEDQADISSVEFTQQWRHIDPTRLPLYAEYRHTDIPVLVPRRNDNGHRDRLWRWTQAAYWNRQRGFRIVEGHHVEGPFNRSVGINIAAQIAGNWDVAIIADSDAWVPPEQLTEAVQLARSSNRLVAAFNEVHEVGEKDTLDLLSGNTLPRQVTAERVRTRDVETQSVMLAITRNCFEQIRGFDPRFVGWGGEDGAAWESARCATGTPLRIEGPAYSLWHKPASRKHQPVNERLWRRYLNARTLGDIHKLRAA